MRREALAAAGMDVDDALDRLLGNGELLGRLLAIFAADDSCERLDAALGEKDVEAARAAAHALKGMCANLSMTRLAALAARMLELLHAGELDAARELMAEVREARSSLLAAIAGA